MTASQKNRRIATKPARDSSGAERSETMRNDSRTRITTVAALLIGAVGLACSPPASAGGPWGANYFPNVTLTTQDGATVRFYDDLLKGKAVAINLIYTTCQDECPLETARLVQVQRLLGPRMGNDIFFYSITIDPKRDTPEVLKAYATKFGVGPGWLFLSGDENDIKLVTKKLGLSRSNDAASKDGHLPVLMLGNEPAGQWMRNSAVDNPRFLATTIRNFMGWRDERPARSYTEAAQTPTPDTGAYLFQSRCGACHTVGNGDAIGPDLAGVTTRRERGWLVRYLRAPDTVLAERDAIAVALNARYKNVAMPNLRLSEGEIALLLSYLEGESPATPPPATRR
jgi:protein SCO1